MAKAATRNRWIMYAHQGFPGELYARVTCHESLDWAKWSLKKYADATVVREQASATLYPFTPEDWESAREMEKVGCPFGYPSRLIEFGPKGGIRVESC
jgi:hypothetical protein